ncbi:MAG: hypothetical protein ACYCPP_05640 [Nitrososphaerales archaeon]
MLEERVSKMKEKEKNIHAYNGNDESLTTNPKTTAYYCCVIRKSI